MQDDHDVQPPGSAVLGGGEIVGHGTEKYAAASNVQNRPGTAQSGLEIMGYHDHGHAFLFIEVRKGLIEILGRCRIQAGNGLIQNQQLSGGAQGTGQQHPLLLTAGELPVALVLELQNAQLAHVHQGLGFLGRRVEKTGHPG